jgi:hypothetical protein
MRVLLLFIALLTLFYKSKIWGFSKALDGCCRVSSTWKGALSIIKGLSYPKSCFGLSSRTEKKSLKYPSSDFFICSYYFSLRV